MQDKCETIGKYLMPLFRSMVAKELIATHKLTQVQTGEILGTTQAAVSQYINSKRAGKGTERYSDIVPKMQKVANLTAEKLVNKQTTWIEVTSNFCILCTSMLEESIKSEYNFSI